MLFLQLNSSAIIAELCKLNSSHPKITEAKLMKEKRRLAGSGNKASGRC